LIERGLAFYWGTSEERRADTGGVHDARREHLIPAHGAVRIQHVPPAAHRARVARLYQEIGLGTTTYSPLASGLLSGKYSQGIPQESRASLKGYDWLREEYDSEEGQEQVRKVEQLRPLAGELDCTLAQLALAWCLKNPNVSTVITGASRLEQVNENMRALDVASLTPEGFRAHRSDPGE
jgi:aryl-alcohol dehydrogenase-like predicted oxidoreductase